LETLSNDKALKDGKNNKKTHGDLSTGDIKRWMWRLGGKVARVRGKRQKETGKHILEVQRVLGKAPKNQESGSKMLVYQGGIHGIGRKKQHHVH